MVGRSLENLVKMMPELYDYSCVSYLWSQSLPGKMVILAPQLESRRYSIISNTGKCLWWYQLRNESSCIAVSHCVCLGFVFLKRPHQSKSGLFPTVFTRPFHLTCLFSLTFICWFPHFKNKKYWCEYWLDSKK